MPSVRLVRYLAQCGVASRRASADLVRQGLVEVNGKVTDDVSLAISPADQVRYKGRPLSPPKKTSVVMLHKPRGHVCSLSDPHNPKTVLDCLAPELRGVLKPVGRLDKQTTGLLLLTDDGDLAHRLTHPRYGVEKVYLAVVHGQVAQRDLARLRDGIELDDGPCAPAQVRLKPRRSKENRSTLEIVIHEGRNRQVRRMCDAIGHSVARLERVAYGPLRLTGLSVGENRLLNEKEYQALRNTVGL